MNGKGATPPHVADPQLDELQLDATFLEGARIAQGQDARAELGECRPAPPQRLTFHAVQRRLSALDLEGVRAPTLAEQRSIRRLERRL